MKNQLLLVPQQLLALQQLLLMQLLVPQLLQLLLQQLPVPQLQQLPAPNNPKSFGQGKPALAVGFFYAKRMNPVNMPPQSPLTATPSPC